MYIAPNPLAVIGNTTSGFYTYIFKNILDAHPLSSTAGLLDGGYKIWSSAKDFFKIIGPYQPISATCWIVSRAFFKTRNKPQINHEIRTLENRRQILLRVYKDGAIDCSQRLSAIRNQIQQKKNDRVYAALSVIQLGSLAYDHPGSNVWHYTNNIYGRLYSLRNMNILQSPKSFVLNTLSVLGTAASFLKITGLTTSPHPVADMAISASFVGMAIESLPNILWGAKSLKTWLNRGQANRI